MNQNILPFPATNNQSAIFKQPDEQTIQLSFGQAQIRISKDGRICLQNANAELVLTADGNIKQQAAKHIYLNTDSEQ